MNENWAETLLRQALDRLAEECALAGKDELFKQLNSHLSVSSEAAVPYEEMSLRLGRPIVPISVFETLTATVSLSLVQRH